MESEPTPFQIVKAVKDVIRYEQTERLYDILRRLKEHDDKDWVFHAKYEDRELTHIEVWDKAIDEALGFLDDELGLLSERQW